MKNNVSEKIIDLSLESVRDEYERSKIKYDSFLIAKNLAKKGLRIYETKTGFIIIIDSVQMQIFGERLKNFLEAFERESPIVPVANDTDNEKGD